MWYAVRVKNHRYNNDSQSILKTPLWISMIKMVMGLQREKDLLPDQERTLGRRKERTSMERKEIINSKQAVSYTTALKSLKWVQMTGLQGTRPRAWTRLSHRDDEEHWSCNEILERGKWHCVFQKGKDFATINLISNVLLEGIQKKAQIMRR